MEFTVGDQYICIYTRSSHVLTTISCQFLSAHLSY